MNECIGHVIGKPHSPVTGLYIGKMLGASLGCATLPGEVMLLKARSMPPSAIYHAVTIFNPKSKRLHVFAAI